MYLEELIEKDNKKEYIESLTDSAKQVLLQEIQDKKKSAESEYIRLETMKTKLEEDEKEEMKKLAELGITSYENLDIEINKLENELNEEILKFSEILSKE
jgi:hypothetical protein